MAGPEVKELFKKLPCKLKELFFEPDGNFPNHEPNPMKEEALIEIKKAVLENKMDLGVVFDGDADRIAFINEKGNSIRGDFITALIAKNLLLEKSRGKIIYEVRSGWIVKETIKKGGGMPILGKTGHSLIKERMRQEDAIFAGELSGHYYFKELGFIENSLLVILKVLEIISQEEKTISEILLPFQKYFQSGEMNFEIINKEEKMKEIEEHFKDASNISRFDGLSVEYNDWWFNIRPSQTEDLLRLNIEAKTKELLEEKKKKLIKLIKN